MSLPRFKKVIRYFWFHSVDNSIDIGRSGDKVIPGDTTCNPTCHESVATLEAFDVLVIRARNSGRQLTSPARECVLA